MIADRFDAFLFDLDGVLYLGNEPIPASIAAVHRLQQRGATVRVLTNNPRLSRQDLATRFQEADLSLGVEAIITSGWAAARFLKQEGMRSADVVGSDGARAACRAAGIALTTENPDAVIVGADRAVTYRSLQRAMDHIARGARFVGTNPDTSFPTPSGRGLGAGAMIQALEAATGTQATIAGKPEPLMFDAVQDTLSPDARPVMIGDNPRTDIAGARRAGIASILLADTAPPDTAADFTVATLAALFDSAADA